MFFLSKKNNPVDIFDDFFDFSDFKPMMRSDVREEKDAFIFDIEMPGFNKEDIKISVENDYLTVAAEKDEVKEDKKYVVRERHYGKVERSFYIGDVQKDNIKASYDNGILTINVPKTSVEETKYITIE
jgi:HSP20 family protein